MQDERRRVVDHASEHATLAILDEWRRSRPRDQKSDVSGRIDGEQSCVKRDHCFIRRPMRWRWQSSRIWVSAILTNSPSKSSIDPRYQYQIQALPSASVSVADEVMPRERIAPPHRDSRDFYVYAIRSEKNSGLSIESGRPDAGVTLHATISTSNVHRKAGESASSPLLPGFEVAIGYLFTGE